MPSVEFQVSINVAGEKYTAGDVVPVDEIPPGNLEAMRRLQQVVDVPDPEPKTDAEIEAEEEAKAKTPRRAKPPAPPKAPKTRAKQSDPEPPAELPSEGEEAVSDTETNETTA